MCVCVYMHLQAFSGELCGLDMNFVVEISKKRPKTLGYLRFVVEMVMHFRAILQS